jgi:glycosyltransferase 2 family protein
LKAQDLLKRALGSRLLKWGFIVLALGIGAYAIYRDRTQIHHALDKIGWQASVAALLALLVMQFATLRTWQVLLAGLGTRLRTGDAGRILFIGQLGKYLPGSVWPILAQMELGTAYKVPRAQSASASILTMLLSLLTGLITAAVTLPFASHSTGYIAVFVAAPVLIACLHPRILNPLLRLAFRLAKRDGLDKPLTGRLILHAIGWSFGAWIFNGLQIWILAVKLGAPPGRTALLALGGYAFAWCVGFLVVFAPAGAGIREVLLIAALQPVLGVPQATAVALVSRVVTTASDVLVAGGAAFRRPRLPLSQPADLPAAPVPASGSTPEH